MRPREARGEPGGGPLRTPSRPAPGPWVSSLGDGRGEVGSGPQPASPERRGRTPPTTRCRLTGPPCSLLRGDSACPSLTRRPRSGWALSWAPYGSCAREGVSGRVSPTWEAPWRRKPQASVAREGTLARGLLSEAEAGVTGRVGGSQDGVGPGAQRTGGKVQGRGAVSHRRKGGVARDPGRTGPEGQLLCRCVRAGGTRKIPGFCCGRWRDGDARRTAARGGEEEASLTADRALPRAGGRCPSPSGLPLPAGRPAPALHPGQPLARASPQGACTRCVSSVRRSALG